MAQNQPRNGPSACIFIVAHRTESVLWLASRMRSSGSREQMWFLLELAKTLSQSQPWGGVGSGFCFVFNRK